MHNKCAWIFGTQLVRKGEQIFTALCFDKAFYRDVFCFNLLSTFREMTFERVSMQLLLAAKVVPHVIQS